MKKTLSLVFCLLVAMLATAQTHQAELSAWVEEICQQENSQQGGQRAAVRGVMPRGDRAIPELCAFVRIEGDGGAVLAAQGARMLDRQGDIYIASIPIDRLSTLATQPQVLRIEANRSHQLLMDTTALVVNALPVYAGEGLPQAYTGQGVVVGVQDVGFDLCHPNFFSADGTRYRIGAFWDMLSVDTIGSTLYVGADYVGEEALRALGRSRDADIMTHGTHTLGTAAGSGADTPYRGMAWESDICIVANAVDKDAPLISKADYYKYTYATDALGFKYMFDYADAQGKPCVVSFSEGSGQDFRGDDVLYYSYLEALAGPGHILVASAGNTGHYDNYFVKTADQQSAGARVLGDGSSLTFTTKSAQPYSLRVTVYNDGADPQIKTFSLEDVMSAEKQQLEDSIITTFLPYRIMVKGYPSCYNSEEMVLEGRISTHERMPDPANPGDSIDVKIGTQQHITIEVVGQGAEVAYIRGSGYLAGDYGFGGFQKGLYGIHSPGSAPCVICVGATTHRTSFTDWEGNVQTYPESTIGEGRGARANYSSIGPTFDERIKPDVLAPGTFVLSSFSSYYFEKEDPADVTLYTERDGRQYPWGSSTGTSMSTPVVAGAVALWLQANPRLTPDDVMGVIERTSRHVDPSATYPNITDGYGEIDVYRGLLDVLSFTGIQEIDTYPPRHARFAMTDGQLTIAFDRPLSQEARVSVFSTSGVKMLTTAVNAGAERTQVSLSSLPRGVYAIQITSDDSAARGSTLVRY